MSELAAQTGVLTAALARVDVAASAGLAAADRFLMVVSADTLPSRFVPRGSGTLGPFDRPSAFIGLFDRVSLAEAAEAALSARHADMIGRLFERREISGFGPPHKGRETFDFRATGGFDFRATGGFDRTTTVDMAIQRVELRLTELASRLRVGF